MRCLNTFVIFLSALITKACLCGITIESPTPEDQGLVEAAVKILESCYHDQISTVGAAGVSAGDIIKRLSSTKVIIPVILIDKTLRVRNNDSVRPKQQQIHKLQFFVVTATDSDKLAKTLQQIKISKWWNHMAFVLLIDWPMSKHRCLNAYEILWEAWKMNLLNTKLICLHQTRGILIYTFNPYTSIAPVPWQLETTHKGFNDHIWSLFVRVYQENVKICDTLDFDKTQNLGKYEVRASVRGMENWWYADPEMKPTIYNRLQNISAQTLMSALNATWKFRLYPASNFRPAEKNGTVYDELRDTVKGISDIVFNIQTQYSVSNYTFTYPHIASGLNLISQYRGNMSQLEKFSSVLDSSSHIGLLIVCVNTLLFFIFIRRESLMPAILNLVRLICNSGLQEISTNLAVRFYLGSLFVFIVTIQGIYSGKLASLLTEQMPLPNVDNLKDLAKFGYTTYGSAVYQPVFEETSLKGRYVGLSKINCTKYVIRDSKAACIFGKYQCINEAVKFGLHMSREMVTNINGLHLIRSDWPLEDRVNSVYQKCFEGNLIINPTLRENHNVMHALESYEDRYNNQPFTAITLEELRFAFVILGIGLICATISFIVEVTFGVI